MAVLDFARSPISGRSASSSVDGSTWSSCNEFSTPERSLLKPMGSRLLGPSLDGHRHFYRWMNVAADQASALQRDCPTASCLPAAGASGGLAARFFMLSRMAGVTAEQPQQLFEEAFVAG